jgi:hypothetical protein
MTDRYARLPMGAIGRRELSASDWRVLACIGLHADPSGRAYPSMAMIAQMTGIRRGDVPRAIRRLEGLGLLQIAERGPRGANVYRITFGPSATVRTVSVRKDADSVAPTVRNRADRTVRNAAAKVSAPVRTKQPNNNPRNRLLARRAAREREHVDEGANSEFEIFWRTYPHRGAHPDPKKPARQKFDAAVKRGVDPADIIAGAERYRAHVEANGTDRRYVAQAVTWLNQERWNDHPETPEPPRLKVGMN